VAIEAANLIDSFLLYRNVDYVKSSVQADHDRGSRPQFTDRRRWFRSEKGIHMVCIGERW